MMTTLSATMTCNMKCNLFLASLLFFSTFVIDVGMSPKPKNFPLLEDDIPDFATAVVDRPEFRALRVPSQPTNSFPTAAAFTKAVSAKCGAFEKYLYQYVAVQYLAARTPYRSMLLFHGLGTGKCHAKDTPILMYDGSIKMVQDIKVGDLLMGDDSTHRKVLSLASGEDDMYDVIPTKGDKYTVNAEHILCLKPTRKGVSKTKNGTYSTVYYQPSGNVTSKTFKTKAEAVAFEDGIHATRPVIEIEVKDYLSLSKTSQCNLKGYRVGIEFKEKPLMLDPRMFGIWLGDGGSREPKITTADAEILEYVCEKIEAMGLYLNQESKYDYRISSKYPKKGSNEFLNFMQHYNLVKNKHIPLDYLANSRKNRLELLAGIIDTDGSLSDGGYEILQKSNKCTEGILYLARSLGYAAYSKKCTKSCMYKGEKREGVYNRIFISGDVCKIPVLLPHKKASPRKQKKDVLVTGLQVHHLGRGKYFGFTISGNNRYLLGDFTVTHNTCSAITVAEAFLIDHREGMVAPIWVVASPALQASFMNEVFNRKSASTCTDGAYLKYFPDAERLEPGVFQRKMRSFINSRYKFWTYEGLANALAANPEPFHDKVIIIDEAHNLRGDGQRLHEQLTTLLPKGKGNRLVLLSATPMFNEPNEILGLFRLLLANDHRRIAGLAADTKLFRTAKQRNVAAFSLVARLAQEYVSFVRGSNPFTFAPRLSPKQSGIPIIEPDVPTREWVSVVRDGLVPTQLGALQEAWWLPRRPKYSKAMSEETEETQAKSLVSAQSQLMQAMNVIYGEKPGRSGFYQVFRSLEASGNTSLSVEYVSAIGCLEPGPRLHECGAKLNRIVEFIQKARGVVMVYSEFVWAGVVPLAIALEHVGFSRYGENNMLATRSKAVPAGSYAILSGTAEVMGRKSFTEVLEALNHSNNKSGQKIKVILLTQVASEGLSLKNIREVHIMEPWYHFNQLEQVIGRAVRTCSHEALPLEDRNVTVFLHCAVASPEHATSPTADEHAYGIAARKLGQIDLVEKALRDNAVDCALNVNVNYVPPSTFGFGVNLRTSQGAIVEWKFGDRSDLKPKCKSSVDLQKDIPVSSLIHMEPIMPTAVSRCKAYLGSFPSGTRVSLPDLIAYTKLPHALAKAAVLRIPEARIHGNVVVVQALNKRMNGRLIAIPVEAEAEAVASTSQQQQVPQPGPSSAGYEQLLSMLPSDDNVAKFTLYSMLVREQFFNLATSVLAHGVTADTARAVKLFDTEGVWVKGKGRDIVGFVNVFTPRATFEVFQWQEGRLDKASNAQTEKYKKSRTFRDVPEKASELQDTIGFFGLKRDRLTAGDNVQLAFQLLMPNSLPGNQRGAFCETKGRDELKALITTLNPTFFKHATDKQYDFRKTLCAVIGPELHKKGQMMYPPFYK